MTRIDTPAAESTLPPGEHRLAGITYVGDRGIRSVEYSPDGGTARQAARFLEPSAGHDTWEHSKMTFTLKTNQELTLMARATDGVALQAEPFSLPQPDGGSG